MKIFTMCSAIVLCAVLFFAPTANARFVQTVPLNTEIRIIQAEDELRFDKDIETLLKNRNDAIRIRAALAAGRIGDPGAIDHLARLLDDNNAEVVRMAFFAIGEIESDDGAGFVLDALKESSLDADVRAAAVEAAGKIGGASKNDDQKRLLGIAVLNVLDSESGKAAQRSHTVVLKGITALLRLRPADPDTVLIRFLKDMDGRIRADSANSLARLGVKTANTELRDMLSNDEEPVARANAARALGAADDKEAVDLLVSAALEDKDSRVRVNAFSALGRLGVKETGAKMLIACKRLFADYGASKQKIPDQTNELLAAATALGAIMKGTDDSETFRFLRSLVPALEYRSPEIEVALVRVSPGKYPEKSLESDDWRVQRAIAQAFGFAASLEETESVSNLKKTAVRELSKHIHDVLEGRVKANLSFPDVLNAYAQFKQDDLADLLRKALRMEDVIVRATSAGLLGETGIVPGGRKLENYFALRLAYERSERDLLNDASLSALEGLKEQFLKLKDEKDVNVHGFETFKRALKSPDYLMRRRAISIAREIGFDDSVSVNRVSFNEKGNTRLKRANYRRAALRKKAKAEFSTAKGKFTIDFYPEAAPLTVENFINLAKSGYFNGLAIHRVVPNFVMQDGDPRGDGSGGPGWHIRCEVNPIPYERGTVGMALSGKDTGGSQWFVAHSPQPHLDGGYTVFGKVNETGMKVVDKLARGDVIRSVKVFE